MIIRVELMRANPTSGRRECVRFVDATLRSQPQLELELADMVTDGERGDRIDVYSHEAIPDVLGRLVCPPGVSVTLKKPRAAKGKGRG